MMSDTNNEAKFIYGVLDTFELKYTNDIASVGRLKGTIHKNDTVYITNYGDDDDELVVSTIVAIEVEKKEVDEATDCFAMLRIRAGLSENIKPGSVIHSENTDREDIHIAYVSAIGDSYVGRRDLEIYETELNKMSITDCSESWRIFAKVHEKKEGGFTEAEIKDFKRKIGILSRSMAKKILAADEIYVVVNKKTGEPHMFSRTNKHNDDFICSPPEIHIFSKPYKDVAIKHFPEELFTIEKISNADNPETIKQYLFDAFYLNGAMGMRVNFEVVAMACETIIPRPNYYGKKDAPVTNPNLQRWMLLRAQIGTPQTDAEKTVARIYYRFFAIELQKAQLVVPMKSLESSPDEETPEIPEELKENGVAPELRKVRFPILVGKNRRNLVFMFTDVKRLRQMYDEEWEIFAQPISRFINNFDVGLNTNNKNQAGCFMNRETYEEIQKMFGLEQQKEAEEKAKAEEDKNAESKAAEGKDKDADGNKEE